MSYIDIAIPAKDEFEVNKVLSTIHENFREHPKSEVTVGFFNINDPSLLKRQASLHDVNILPTKMFESSDNKKFLVIKPSTQTQIISNRMIEAKNKYFELMLKYLMDMRYQIDLNQLFEVADVKEPHEFELIDIANYLVSTYQYDCIETAVSELRRIMSKKEYRLPRTDLLRQIGREKVYVIKPSMADLDLPSIDGFIIDAETNEKVTMSALATNLDTIRGLNNLSIYGDGF